MSILRAELSARTCRGRESYHLADPSQFIQKEARKSVCYHSRQAKDTSIVMNEDKDPAEDLLQALDLEAIDSDIFRGQNEDRKGMGPRLFGGQVLGQALAAASRTVDEDRPCHSLHAYFLRPGSPSTPVLYSVDRIRDGRSFTTRRIVAVQNGEAIFSMDVSFQLLEPGLEHQIDTTGFPSPDELDDDMVVARRLPKSAPISGWARRARPFELKSVYPLDQERPDNNLNPVWIRFRNPVTDKRLHQYLLAYASDMGLVSTAMLPHRHDVPRNQLQMASLDHAMWFHREFEMTDWLIYIKETPTAAASRGFNRGSFYTRDGKLVCSTIQEGLMRVREDDT